MPAISKCRLVVGSAPHARSPTPTAFLLPEGPELGLRPETLQALTAPAVPPRRGFYDECIKGEIQFSLGFMKPSRELAFGHPGAFGAPGAGGSLGFRRPSNRDRVCVCYQPHGRDKRRSTGSGAEKRDSLEHAGASLVQAGVNATRFSGCVVRVTCYVI